MFYRMMLEELREVIQNVQIVLCEPFILPAGKVGEDWDQWAEEMKVRQGIVNQLSNDYKTIYIPLQSKFNEASKTKGAEYWLFDGIHPTPAGHHLIAHEWIKMVL